MKGQCVPSLGNKVICRCPGFTLRTNETVLTIICHSRKSILGSILTVLSACFSIKLVTEHACLEYKEI